MILNPIRRHRRRKEWRVHGASLAKAIEVANALREANGAKTLVDLPLGVPHRAKKCFLARAFNFDCSVYRDKAGWVAAFHGIDGRPHARVLAEALELPTPEQPSYLSSDYPYESIVVPLPTEIGLLAARFDAGLLRSYESRR